MKIAAKEVGSVKYRSDSEKNGGTCDTEDGCGVFKALYTTDRKSLPVSVLPVQKKQRKSECYKSFAKGPERQHAYTRDDARATRSDIS